MKSKNMEMGSNVPLFALIVLILFHYCHECTANGGDTLSLGASLTGNQTIISESGTFALGFFSPNGNSSWYIGIWYAKVPEKTIVWVANREAPANERPGVLKLSTEGGLGVFDAEGTSLWSVNMSNKASRAVILDSGNFVVLSDGNKSEPAWQSFDDPTDTWLPGMKIGGRKKLVCWKNSLDPAPGLFAHEMDPSGIEQFVLRWDNSVQYWESGAWDGTRFSEIPEMTLRGSFRCSVENTTSSFLISYEPSPALKVLTRFVVDKSGVFELYFLYDNITWSLTWSQPRDPCSVYNICGSFGSCNSNNVHLCSCVEGFVPRDNRSWSLQDWSSTGCVRQTPLDCHDENGSTDGFIASGATLPDEYAFSYPSTTESDCERACLHNCSCTAYVFNPSSGPCKIWSGDLPTMGNSSLQSNADVFIRLAASALGKFDHQRSSSKRRTTVSIVGSVLGIFGALAIALCIYSFFAWQRHRLRSMQMLAESSNAFLKMFTYRELKTATGNFRCKLGTGGFGSVFKGTLTDGTLVAVKKLEGSRQDEKQFRAEIHSLGSIQHVNLVRLRGFCAERSERLLVYEYVPNGSLNSLLFSGNLESKPKGKVLDWNTRFEIALGTARGILYLHEECRDRIIHFDVKPENILLDSELSPKLADFGMAKLVGRDFSRVLTTMRGTRGYLAPEWLSGLPITPKVDVYSFGMTLLEIISGRRNLDTSLQDPNKHYFPSWAAAQIYEGNTDKIVEEYVAFAEEADVEEVKRAIAVGLLCIEEDENVRPSMRQVIRMLQGKMEPPSPQISSDSDVIACGNVSGDPV